MRVAQASAQLAAQQVRDATTAPLSAAGAEEAVETTSGNAAADAVSVVTQRSTVF